MRNEKAVKDIEARRKVVYRVASNIESKHGKKDCRLERLYRKMERFDSAIASLTCKIN